MKKITDISFYDSNGKISGNDYISFYYGCEEGLVGCNELGQLDAEYPTNFTLNQNYPNPFNPITTIEFTLDKNDNIRLNIYDINGRKIRTLISGFTLSGSYSIKWNGTDYKGNNMPSGIYIYQLVSSTNSATNKMILLR